MPHNPEISVKKQYVVYFSVSISYTAFYIVINRLLLMDSAFCGVFVVRLSLNSRVLKRNTWLDIYRLLLEK